MHYFVFDESPDCFEFAVTFEDSEHIMFDGPRFVDERGRLSDVLYVNIGLYDLVEGTPN